ncbi:hypothetical protein GGI24_003634, partial [Coemansia furcata]
LLVGLATQLTPALAADVVFGYLPTWQTDKAEGVDMTKYTHITIAFAIPDENGQITMDNRDGMMKDTLVVRVIHAGIPASKINAGLPFYGRTVTANGDMTNPRDMYQPLSKTIPHGDGDDKEESDISCGGPKLFSGIWKYTNLRGEGVLDAPDSASAPWVRHYDNATNTPWLFNKDTKDFISYDDMTSISAKAEYVAEKGLAGVMVWPITNDYENELVNAVLVAFNN